MGSVTAFAKPQSANNDVTSINGKINFLSTMAVDEKRFFFINQNNMNYLLI